MNLEDLLPVYPDEYTEDFSHQLFRKKEFNELRLDPIEKKPEIQGELLKDQLFIKRFISGHTTADSVLLFRGIGTGKSCVLSAIVENFKNTTVGGKKRNPALVFVRNEGLGRSLKREISTVCTPENTYSYNSIKMNEGEVLTEDTKKRRLNKLISQTYQLETFSSFFLVKGKPRVFSEEEIEFYSNRIIIFDESHHIHPTGTKGKEKVDGEEITNKDMNVNLYKSVHEFLHRVKSCRKFLSTGSPFWDRVEDIATQMNLILPLEDQFITGSKFESSYFNTNGDLKEEKREELVSKFGKVHVSYIRSMINVERREIGVTKPWLDVIKVYPDAMSDFQYETWTRARDEETEVAGGRTQKGGTALRLARDASNIVYPDIDSDGNLKEKGIYGPKAFKKYVELYKVGTKYRYRFNSKFPLVKEEFKNNLYKYSTKIASILEDIKTHPEDPVFIYTGEFVTGGGAIVLGLILELHGFIQARESSQLKTGEGEEGRNFVVMTSRPGTINEPKTVESIIKKINSPDNIGTKVCRIVIVSKNMSEGYTFKGFKRFHSLVPDWNIPSREQSEGRVYRFGAHDRLPEEERYVEIFNHVAVKRGSKELKRGFPVSAKFSKTETTDIHVSRIAEAKDKKNVSIYRIMKEVALDCAINYQRNVLKGDVSHSKTCDYRECNYTCLNYPEELIDKSSLVWNYNVEDIDYSSYDLYHSLDEEIRLQVEILEIFSKYFSLTLEDLIVLTEGKENILLRVLSRIISSRLQIVNRYGYSSYLKEENDLYFLTDDPRVDSKFIDSIYTRRIYVEEKTTLDDVISVEKMERDLEKLKCGEELTEEMLKELSIETLIIHFEMVYSENDGEVYQALKNVLNFNSNFWSSSDGSLSYHTFYRENYSTMDKYIPPGLTRLYSRKNKEWRDATDLQEEFVLEKLSEKKKKDVESFTRDGKSYGKMKDGDLYVVVGDNKGRKCITIPRAKLEEIRSDVGMDSPKTKVTNTALCKMLENHLRKKKRLLE